MVPREPKFHAVTFVITLFTATDTFWYDGLTTYLSHFSGELAEPAILPRLTGYSVYRPSKDCQFLFCTTG